MNEQSTNDKFVITVFKSLYDTDTSKTIVIDCIDKFHSFLFACSAKHRFNKKKDAALFSPVVYKEGTTRKNINADYCSRWFALDVDSFDFDNSPDAPTLREQFENTFPEITKTYRYICYSTASSKIEKPKFRVIFPLQKSISYDDITIFWHVLNSNMEKQVDKQTKDIARMFYQPGTYKDANNFIWSNFDETEELIDAKQMIDDYTKVSGEDAYSMFGSISNNAVSFIDRLPKEFAKEVTSFRKNQLDNNKNKFNWTGYENCPFVNDAMVNEYRSIVYLKNIGRYLGLYQLMVSIAVIAIKKGYPINSNEIEDLVREIDSSIDGYYKKRKISTEVERALEFAYRQEGVFNK